MQIPRKLSKNTDKIFLLMYYFCSFTVIRKEVKGKVDIFVKFVNLSKTKYLINKDNVRKKIYIKF
ncbi:hypothetical protein EG343_03990 [Chryseobacterium nakagawai]|uniref:Uncharacterized protein n=1 Tax=Chryseobacterium nakagawai TaxID=1241982 RepID=A0AAD0YIT2_CHRNA|nr:hypothetical protein EG343_03990 [Chryseobacterium nakagawai]